MATIQNFDVNVPKEDLNNAIIQQLRLLGLKNGVYPKRLLKSCQNSKVAANHGCVFRKPLHLMPSRIVQLQSGVEAEVPNFVQEVCCCVVQHADIEGLFRKGGSAARQKEIRALLDEGIKVQLSHHHVIDIANILKFFLRELPEPVLPFAYHDLFLQCLLLEDTVGAVLLVCLLLPRPHLYILAYLMEFFHLISRLSESNKMTSSNLAIVITPSLMPMSDKMSIIQNPQRLNAHVRVVEILITNAERIAVLPDGVVGKLSLTPSMSNLSLVSDDQCNGAASSSKKRRRRSGSLTRMFNGLRKIVGGKASPGFETDHRSMEEEVALVPPSSDIKTPCVKAGKKRKALDAASAFSSKKKKDVLKALPQSTALADTPFKKNSCAVVSESIDTPRVCPHPNPPNLQKTKSKSPQKSKHHRFFASRTYSESDNRSIGSTAKKGLSELGNFVIRKQKTRHDRHSTSGNFLERSWSAVSSSNWGRKKSRQSEDQLSVLSSSNADALVESDSSQDADLGIDLSQEDPFDTSSSDFVKVPKSEYEDLKSRMCAIESCISQEFSNVSTLETKPSSSSLNAADTVLAVQNVYEKTLEDADISKDASADQLAKRLSRELKIRRSSECKVIRSPSARKIGSLRRRSKERQSPSLRRELRRNKSWHMMHRPAAISSALSIEIPSAHCSRLRRGRPNTVFSGLPHPTPSRVTKETKHDGKVSILGGDVSPLNTTSPVTRSQARRASSFHGSEASLALPSSKKSRSQVNIAKAALLAHAQRKCKMDLEQDDKWHDAQELLNSSKDLLSGLPASGRESIAKLRSENAGKVLATAKLFNGNTNCSKQIDVRRSKVHETATSGPCLSNVQEPLFVQDKAENLQNTGEDKFVENVVSPGGKFSKVLSGCPGPVGAMSSRNISKAVRTLSDDQSPVVSVNWRKRKGKSSPSGSPIVRPAGSKLKKHSSMKTERAAHSQPVRRNLSVPVQLAGKENQTDAPRRNSSPKIANKSVPLTECIQRISVSPLKDCNRITMQNKNPPIQKYPQGAPCSTPTIKQPLTVHTPRRKAFTPQSMRSCSGNTPMKVLATSAITPVHTGHQLSTRLQHGVKSSGKLARSYK